MSGAYAVIGEVIRPEGYEIDGGLVRVPGHYDYSGDACRCPVCGGTGWPWGGWFHCEDWCVAIIETGECFVPASAWPREDDA